MARPRLDLALLTERVAPYLLHRLTYFAGRVALRTAFHALELMLMLGAIPPEWAAVFIAIRTAAGILAGLHWGALEHLRRRVRLAVSAGQHASATALLEGWIALSVIVGSLLLIGSVAWVALAWDRGAPSVGDLFLLASATKVGATLVARTFHAGIYAVQGVRRPLWTLWLPEIVDFVVLFGLWQRLGMLAFVAQSLVSALVRVPLLLHYARRAYANSRLRAPRWLAGASNLRRVTWAGAWAATQAALAGAFAHIDGVVVLLLVAVGPSDNGVSLGLLCYVLRPLMASAHDWTRAFYRDFSRAGLLASAFFRRRLRRLLLRVSIVVSAVIFVSVYGATWLLWNTWPPWAALWLLPFFVARSQLSLRHLEVFTQQQHGRLAVLIVSVLTLTVAMSLFELPLFLLAAMAPLVLVAMVRALAAMPRDASDARMLGLPAWLHALTSQGGRVSLAVIRVDHRLVNTARVMRVLADVGAPGLMTKCGRAHVLWFRSNQGEAWSREDMLRIGGGCIASLYWRDEVSGVEAIARAWHHRALPDVLGKALAQSPISEDELMRVFAVAHPDGQVLRPGTGSLRRVPTAQLTQWRVMDAVMAEASGRQAHAGGHAVSLFAPRGEPLMVFVTGPDRQIEPAFRRLAREATLRASLADALPRVSARDVRADAQPLPATGR